VGVRKSMGSARGGVGVGGKCAECPVKQKAPSPASAQDMGCLEKVLLPLHTLNQPEACLWQLPSCLTCRRHTASAMCLAQPLCYAVQPCATQHAIHPPSCPSPRPAVVLTCPAEPCVPPVPAAACVVPLPGHLLTAVHPPAAQLPHSPEG
jgi:hypothetical protein